MHITPNIVFINDIVTTLHHLGLRTQKDYEMARFSTQSPKGGEEPLPSSSPEALQTSLQTKR